MWSDIAVTLQVTNPRQAYTDPQGAVPCSAATPPLAERDGDLLQRVIARGCEPVPCADEQRSAQYQLIGGVQSRSRFHRV